MNRCVLRIAEWYFRGFHPVIRNRENCGEHAILILVQNLDDVTVRAIEFVVLKVQQSGWEDLSRDL